MKRFVICAAALVAFTSSTFAQINTSTIAIPTRQSTPTYSLQLTAIPANQVAYGTPVTLTARVMVLPPNTVPSAATVVPTSRVRFTFKAQMTSPCALMNPIAISTNSGFTVNWNPPKGGTYTITAHVAPVSSPFPVTPKLPDSIADATLNYTVTGGPPQPSNLPSVTIISTPVVPPSGGGTAPVDAFITLNMNAPSYPALYWVQAGCETAGVAYKPCTWTAKNYYPTGPVHFPALHLVASGQYLLAVSGAVIRQSDCQATGGIYTHTNPYTVN